MKSPPPEQSCWLITSTLYCRWRDCTIVVTPLWVYYTDNYSIRRFALPSSNSDTMFYPNWLNLGDCFPSSCSLGPSENSYKVLRTIPCWKTFKVEDCPALLRIFLCQDHLFLQRLRWPSTDFSFFLCVFILFRSCPTASAISHQQHFRTVVASPPCKVMCFVLVNGWRSRKGSKDKATFH